MNIDLHGKSALVTGASSGIGQAIAIELAGHGAYVTVNYHSNETGARETIDAIKQAGGDGQIVGADVSQAAQVEQLMQAVVQHAPHLDILVNNAGGMVKRTKLLDMTEAFWDETMAINVKSTFLCCKAAVPLMKGGGRIINMSSVAAHDGGGAGASAYATSKGAILTFTKGLAKELAVDGITVNCVAPGLIATAFHDVHTTPDARQGMVKNTPIAREGQPSDVAGAVLFLVSSLADYLTGETININGGSRMS